MRTGVSQDFTGLVAAVQLRLRVAIGLQALQRCSGLLNRRARGSTVATHHFRIRGEIMIILRFERRVCRWKSCRMHHFELITRTPFHAIKFKPIQSRISHAT